MPEMTFGRSIRYRRNKLGLSQTRLGELVGRSAAAVRSREKDASTPSDPSVLPALSAVLGIETSVLFEKAGVDTPLDIETSPTIEQSLGELTPAGAFVAESADSASAVGIEILEDEEDELDQIESEENLVSVAASPVAEVAEPSFTAPREQLLYATPAPPVAEPTYIEDESQRQLYRIRHLATAVVVVALLMMFIWAMGNGWDAFTGWWGDFVGNLKV
jgi:transcriptional regulator with XRE-family HTH domain